MLRKKRVERYKNEVEKILSTSCIISEDIIMKLLEVYDKAIISPGSEDWCKSELLPIIKNHITDKNIC